MRAAVVAGCRTYGEAARYVASALYTHDLGRVGPVTDLGIFRSWYLVEARRLLDRLDGQVIRLHAPAVIPSTGRGA